MALQTQDNGVKLRISSGKLDLEKMAIGDSVAVSGVCLTVVYLTENAFECDLSQETLSRTTLGDLQLGSQVNLELALTLKDPLGGHLISGHCDGVGTVLERIPEGESVRFSIAAPVALARYIAEKGSIAVDGVSLTVNAVQDNIFEVNIIPHTLRATTLNKYQPGRKINLEVDLFARYLERLLFHDSIASSRRNIGKTLFDHHNSDC